MIQLDIYQQNVTEKTKKDIEYYNLKTESVYLIDINNLNKYKYKKIKEIINKKIVIKNIKDNYKDINELINK